MQVTFIKDDVTVSEILKVIQDAGFTAELLQKQDIEARQEVLRSLHAAYQLPYPLILDCPRGSVAVKA